MSKPLEMEEIRQLVRRALPSPNDYRVVLEILAAGIQQAGSHGDDRWALKLQPGDIPTFRFYVGPVIIQSLVPSGLWLSFDREAFAQLAGSNLLHEYLSQDSGGMFKEHPEYPSIDAQNYYLFPSGQRWSDFESGLWPDVRKMHFAAIDRAAARNRNGVGLKTGMGHQPEVVHFIEEELNIQLPTAKEWGAHSEDKQHPSLADLGEKTKAIPTANLEKNDYKIQLYENPDWVFTVSNGYVERLRAIGIYNDKGKRRSNCPVDEPRRGPELERLTSFINRMGIPLAKAHHQRQKLEKARILEGREKREEIANILKRFDQSFYRSLEKWSRDR